MSDFMTVTVRSGDLATITYFRKQKKEHPNHKESRAFSRDAEASYRALNNLDATVPVDVRNYMSRQGRPNDLDAVQI